MNVLGYTTNEPSFRTVAAVLFFISINIFEFIHAAIVDISVSSKTIHITIDITVQLETIPFYRISATIAIKFVRLIVKRITRQHDLSNNWMFQANPPFDCSTHSNDLYIKQFF